MNDITEISNRIKQLRLAHGMEQTDVASYLGYKSFTTISKWENGKNLPDGKKLTLLAKLFNTTTDYILHGEESEQTLTPPLPDSVSKLNQELNQKNHTKWVDYGNELLQEQNTVQEESADYDSEKVVKLHNHNEEYEHLIVHGLESAGDGIWQEDDADIEVRIPKNKIPDKFDDLAMVIGDSMLPKLHNGDILFIAFTKQIEIGEIGVFRTSKGNFVKRLQPDRLESLNPDYDDVYFTEDEFAEAVGVVVDVYRK